MRVLILEDDDDRRLWFKRKLDSAGFKFDLTKDPQEAIRLLQKYEYTNIFLDHDLEFEHYMRDVNCNKTTGLCVAEWLGNNPSNNPRALIIIHSMNENGSRRMLNALKAGKRVAEWIWYPELKKRMITKPNVATY